MGKRSTQSKARAFYYALRTPQYVTTIELAITALISMTAIVFLCAPMFLLFVPSLYVALTYAAILMGLVSFGFLVRVAFAGIRKQRIKFILYSLVPLIISYFLFILSIVLVNGYAIHSTTYWQYAEQLQNIRANGLDRLVAVTLTTFGNLQSIWIVLIQLTSLIIGWIVWIANIHNLISVHQQIRDYDSMVTFPDIRLWFLGGLFTLALLLSLIIF